MENQENRGRGRPPGATNKAGKSGGVQISVWLNENDAQRLARMKAREPKKGRGAIIGEALEIKEAQEQS